MVCLFRKTGNDIRVHIINNNQIKESDNTIMKEKLKIIPLGGLNEIGKNMTVIEYGNDIVVIDCGVAFPDDDMLGVDLVIPDTTYRKRNLAQAARRCDDPTEMRTISALIPGMFRASATHRSTRPG